MFAKFVQTLLSQMGAIVALMIFIKLKQCLPVVATRCGGPESIITPANGLLVPTDDIAALAAALLELY